MDLVEFLRQRLDDDERWAQMLMEDPRPEPVMTYLGLGPARVLREVESKRRIVAMHHYDNDGYGPCCYVCADADQTGSREGDWPCDTLKLLALPYADHESYDEAWKP